MDQESNRPPAIVPLLIIIGGILVIVSYALHWGRVAGTAAGSGHRDIKGGTVVLIAGIIGIVLGLALWAVRSRGVRILLGIIAIIGGLLAVLVGATGFSKSFIRDTVADQLGDENNVSHSEAEQQLKQDEEAGKIKTSTQPGIYAALAGGVLILIGGIGGLATGRKKSAGLDGTGAGVPPPPGAGEGQFTQAPPPMTEGPGSAPSPPPPPPAQPGPPPPEPPSQP